MFCYQCQETAGCTGCTRAGVCGKSARTAALQDLLVYVTRGLCQLTTALRNQGEAIIPEDDRLVTENLFVTITNANFDDDASAPLWSGMPPCAPGWTGRGCPTPRAGTAPATGGPRPRRSVFCPPPTRTSALCGS